VPISWFRGGAAIAWVAGIAGMIATSINGNNNGWVVTFGCITAFAAVCLFSATAAIRRDRIDVFEEADAERLEDQVQALVAAGADETAVRELIRDAMRLGRRREKPRG
jgi:predicted MFS family arabinose efflux permease